MDFPRGSDAKASAYNAGDLGSIPGSGRSSGERRGISTNIIEFRVHTVLDFISNQ